MKLTRPHIPYDVTPKYDSEGWRTHMPPGHVCLGCSDPWEGRWVPIGQCPEALVMLETEEAATGEDWDRIVETQSRITNHIFDNPALYGGPEQERGSMRDLTVTPQGLTNAAELLLLHYMEYRTTQTAVDTWPSGRHRFQSGAEMFLALFEQADVSWYLMEIIEETCGVFEPTGVANMEAYQTRAMPLLCAALEKLVLEGVKRTADGR